MPVENATYISELNPDWPVGKSDFVSEGDDHFRMMKKSLQNTIPNADAPITGTPTQLNNLTNGINWVDNSATAGAASYFEVTDPTSTDETPPDAPLVVGTPTVTQYNSVPGLALNWQTLMGIFFPVGAEYKSYTDNRNPSDILGFGTWEAVTGTLAGVGLATGEDGNTFTYKVGSAGFGLVRHTDLATATYSVALTMNPLEPHSHGVPADGGSSGTDWVVSLEQKNVSYGDQTSSVSAGVPTGTGSVNIGQATTTYAPTYNGAYVWKRTA
ncbi:phage baseplate protein [Kluyvera georgiana]|uniref:phage baseplate protein n=1 Tax=Kluyvera georgiana TaxID=73098 RepID=UPI003AF12558